MIDCPKGDIRDLLPDLLHDRLSPAQRREVEQHVASCDPCGEELALLRDLRVTMSRAPVVDVAAIAAAIPPYRAATRRSWVGWRAAAAITLIAAGGTSVAILGHRPGSTELPGSVVASAPNAQAAAPPSSTPTPRSAGTTPSGVSTPADSHAVRAVPQGPTSAVGAGEEVVAMGGAVVAELSDRELSALIGEIDRLDALPSADVESASGLLPAIASEGTP